MRIFLVLLLTGLASAALHSWDDVKGEPLTNQEKAWERRDDSEFLIGVGLSDITGPAAEIGMVGKKD